jgi:hypothetical protein
LPGQHLKSWLADNASVVAQGCADFSFDSTDRNYSFTPDPRRASPSLCPGFGFRYTQVLKAQIYERSAKTFAEKAAQLKVGDGSDPPT